jgi:hypothetical protein
MRSLAGFTTLPCIFIGSLASCSFPADPQDAVASAPVNDGAVDGADTYFAVTADLRKCPSPLCGGWFLRSLNRPMTRCHDGQYAAACYTPVIDWSRIKLSDAKKAELLDASSKDATSGAVYAMARGRIVPTNRTTPHPEMGGFVITEAWVAEGTTVANGLFVKVQDNGMRCFAAPCPNLTEQTVNTPRFANIAAIDWKPAELTDDQIEECIQLMYSPDGIMVAGDRYMVHDDDGDAKARTATAAYYRLTDAEQ